MTGAAKVYGEALYSLAREEGRTEIIARQLAALKDAFSQEKRYLQLLSVPNLSKQERCRLLDEAFQGSVDPYVLNFLKILTEKGYIQAFPQCCNAYAELYDRDNGILRVTAYTAVAMTEAQQARLTGKLRELTGKNVVLTNRVTPDVLGGVRLDYDGKQLDDTVAHRLAAMGDLLKKSVL